MSRFFHRAATFALLLPLAGCELVSIETDIPELCIGFNNRVMAGVRGGQAFERSVLADPLKTFGAYIELDAEITRATATLHLRSGATDLSFLDSLEVTLKGAEVNSQVAPIALVSCLDYACASDSTATTISTTPPTGVMDAIQAGRVELEVKMTGDLPENDWVVDIELCVTGKARASISL